MRSDEGGEDFGVIGRAAPCDGSRVLPGRSPWQRRSPDPKRPVLSPASATPSRVC